MQIIAGSSKRSVCPHFTVTSLSRLQHLSLPYHLLFVKENSKMHTVSSK